MDILHLIDRLEETFKSSKNLPFSNLRLVDERGRPSPVPTLALDRVRKMP